ncbi:MAG: hypothetical protein ACRDQA_28920 [Nocardioidaceae bacterium]
MLANLFMHYAFDLFLAREFPTVQFERDADHAVVHRVTERQAREVWVALAERPGSVGLRLHPDKTKLVYCKDAKRRGSFGQVWVTFRGFTFRPRKERQKDGRFYVGFLPAVSPEALKAMGQQVRDWRIHLRTGLGLKTLAEWINPTCRAG